MCMPFAQDAGPYNVDLCCLLLCPVKPKFGSRALMLGNSTKVVQVLGSSAADLYNTS